MWYPNDMELRWYERSIWGVIVKVDKESHWKEIRYFTCYDCANLYSEMLKEKKK